MRVAKCDFMKSEIKYLGRVVSAESVKPKPKAVTKLRDCQFPRDKTEMKCKAFWASPTITASSFFGMPSRCTSARHHGGELHLRVGGSTTAGLQRNQESSDRGDSSRAARLGRRICAGH